MNISVKLSTTTCCEVEIVDDFLVEGYSSMALEIAGMQITEKSVNGKSILNKFRQIDTI